MRSALANALEAISPNVRAKGKLIADGLIPPSFRTMAARPPVWPPRLMDRLTVAGLCAAALALAFLMLAAATAEAQSGYRQVPPPPGVYAPTGARGPSRPPWAQPNECYIDEGYGRFSPCR